MTCVACRKVRFLIAIAVFASIFSVAAQLGHGVALRDNSQGNAHCNSTSAAKPHWERFQIFYASLLGIFSASAVYLIQQNFSRWWTARSAWMRVHALIASCLQQLLQVIVAGHDAENEIRIDLSWVIRHAAESGVESIRLTALLDTIAEIDWIQKKGSNTQTLNDLQARLTSRIKIWDSLR